MTTGVYEIRTPIDRPADRKLAEYKVMLFIVSAIVLGLDNNSALSAAAAHSWASLNQNLMALNVSR